MRTTLKFDKNKDFREVENFGYVDLVKCLQTGAVPADVTGSMSSYNGIEDPSTIIGTPTDVFEAMRMSSTLSAESATSD